MRPAPFLALVLAACRVGPEYERPRPPADLDTALPAASAAFPSTEPWAAWWKVFGDARLDELVASAFANNHDVRAAAARVQAARALARASAASSLPQLDVNASGQRQQRSAESFVPNGQSLGIGRPFNLFSATLDARYELDLFGRTARADEAASADAAAAEADRHAITISVAAEVALAWFDLCAATEELAVLQETIATRASSLQVVVVRRETGLATELEERQAEGALAAARAAEPLASQRRTLAGHRLALLCGKPPTANASEVGHALATLPVPPVIPIGLPATLLERRPDLRAAEARLVAATARQAQAVAEFFPSVTLVGSFGYEARDFDRIGKGTTELWSIGPGIHLPIFSGGRLRAQELQRIAETDEAEARYARAVLEALKEVADAIVTIDSVRASLQAEEAAVAAERRVRAISTVRYEEGLATYLAVLDAQRSELAARLAVLHSRRAMLGAVVGLCKALGGGFERDDAASPREPVVGRKTP